VWGEKNGWERRGEVEGMGRELPILIFDLEDRSRARKPLPLRESYNMNSITNSFFAIFSNTI